MYEQFYGFTKRPFSISPDPNFIYLNSDYREALAVMQYAIAQRKGIVSLIGEVGTGKTMLINTLLKDLDRQVTPILLSCPELSYRELIEFVQIQLGIRICSKNPSEQISALYRYLLDAKKRGRTVVLIIDEAQSLSVKMLEFLRLLSNLETSEEKLIQILLSGQPELKAKLNLPELRQFKQRIAISFQLGRLKPEEVPLYIAHRLKVSGYTAGLRLFTDKALKSIEEYSTGIPRLINAICENGLATGYVLSKPQIDQSIVEEAARDLMLETPQASPKQDTASSEARIIPLKAEPSLPQFKNRKKARIASFFRFLIVTASLVATFWIVTTDWPLLKESPSKWWIEESPQKTVHRFIQQKVSKIKTYLSLKRLEGPDAIGSEAGQETDTPSNPSTEIDLPPMKTRTIPDEPFDRENRRPLPIEYIREAFPEQREQIDRHISFSDLREEESGVRTVTGEEDSFEGRYAPAGFKDERAAVSSTESGPRDSSGNPLAEKADGLKDPEVLPAAVKPEEQTSPVRMIRRGDTICKILIETYGFLTPYIWALVHLANPEIRDLNLILIGSELRLPRLTSESAIFKNDAGVYQIYLNAAADNRGAEMLKSVIERDTEIQIDISFAQLTSGLSLYLLQAGRFDSRRAAFEALREFSEISSISKIMEARNESDIRTVVTVRR